MKEHVGDTLDKLAEAGVPLTGSGDKGVCGMREYEDIVKHVETKTYEEPKNLQAKLNRIFKLQVSIVDRIPADRATVQPPSAGLSPFKLRTTAQKQRLT